MHPVQRLRCHNQHFTGGSQSLQLRENVIIRHSGIHVTAPSCAHLCGSVPVLFWFPRLPATGACQPPPPPLARCRNLQTPSWESSRPRGRIQKGFHRHAEGQGGAGGAGGVVYALTNSRGPEYITKLGEMQAFCLKGDILQYVCVSTFVAKVWTTEVSFCSPSTREQG